MLEFTPNKMAAKYPVIVNLRLTNEDMARLKAASQKLDIPCSILIRNAWREWAINQSTEKPLVLSLSAHSI